MLPLAKTLEVAVIGGAADLCAQSALGGSGAVNASETVVTPLAGIRAEIGAANVIYALGSYGTGSLPVMPSCCSASRLPPLEHLHGAVAILPVTGNHSRVG